MEDIKLWVKNNFEPWDDIKANWIKSRNYRMRNIKSLELSTILKEWPRYNDSSGYHLVIANGFR